MVYAYETPKGRPVALCEWCGRELFEGETVYRVGDSIYCTGCVETEVLERDDY